MNSKYRSILFESKKLNGTGLLQKANAFNITADKILYEYALEMVRTEDRHLGCLINFPFEIFFYLFFGV